jgi:hypothetical protein
MVKENGSWQYSQHLQSLFSNKKGVRERGLPHDPTLEDETEDTLKSKPIFTVDEFNMMGESITFTISYGVQTGHDTAMADPDNEGDEDLDISNHYPSRKYRGVLILPHENESKEAILALEAISRACPRTPLIRWIAQWSKSAAIPSSDEKTPPWWKLIGNPMSDEDTLAQFLKNAAAETIHLKRNKVTDDRKRETDVLDLRVEIIRESTRKNALNKVAEWVNSQWSGNRVEDHEAARSVAALFGDELKGIDFDEAKIEILDPISGKKKIISPSRLPDVFTYPIKTDIAPELSVLHASIRAVVERVQPSLSRTMSWAGWPPPKE